MKNQKLQQAEEYLKSGREIIKIVLDPATRLTVRERALKRCIISFADFALQHSGEQPEEEVELNEKPMVTEIYCDNGELSHYELINTENGEVMWSSFPEETNAMGRKIQSQKQAWLKERMELVEGLRMAIKDLWLYTKGGNVSSPMRLKLGDLHRLAGMEWPEDEPKFKMPENS